MRPDEHAAPAGTSGVAATVVLLRAATPGAPGVEVLLLERPHDRGSFRGGWVFPGGAVDPDDLLECAPPPPDAAGHVAEDLAEEAASRRAAVRETREETGLLLDGTGLVPLSRWHPPREAPKRLRTWFWLAAAPAGRVALDPREAVAHRWLTPDAALALHAVGGLRLFPPTWVTLHGLLGTASVADGLRRARGSARAEFVTRVVPGADMTIWPGDIAYDGEHGDPAVDPGLLEAPGPRNRLEMRELPWRYLREG